METAIITERLMTAVDQLYRAFHENRLDAFKCTSCAVGNMCNTDFSTKWVIHWANGIDQGRMPYIADSGVYSPPTHPHYSLEELTKIEKIFLSEWAHHKSSQGSDKEIQAKGLVKVVKYLCELDRVENVMDYTKLFEVDSENKPKYLSCKQ